MPAVRCELRTVLKVKMHNAIIIPFKNNHTERFLIKTWKKSAWWMKDSENLKKKSENSREKFQHFKFAFLLPECSYKQRAWRQMKRWRNNDVYIEERWKSKFFPPYASSTGRFNEAPILCRPYVVQFMKIQAENSAKLWSVAQFVMYSTYFQCRRFE